MKTFTIATATFNATEVQVITMFGTRIQVVLRHRQDTIDITFNKLADTETHYAQAVIDWEACLK